MGVEPLDSGATQPLPGRLASQPLVLWETNVETARRVALRHPFTVGALHAGFRRPGWTGCVRRSRRSGRAVVWPTASVRSRDVTLDAVGDINMGDGVADVMARYGFRFPWGGVARGLRAVDLAFGNLECAVSARGRKGPNKQYNFRGRPAALREVARYAGMDVLNLANNHSGDFGRTALLDTIRWVRHFGIRPVGAGRTLGTARRPRVVTRLGLRVAFVGFSDINPPGFGAGPGRPGTVFATPARVLNDVRRAARRSDVVIVTFHWGVERMGHPTGRQRALARAALAGGARAVIGAHPHVLQPVVRARRGVIAYSLGNFVWAAGSGPTSHTGILRMRLSTRGIRSARLLPAHISGARPALIRR